MGGSTCGGGLRTLVRLERRHVRANARFLLFAAGTDIDEERDLLDRAYQLYLLIFMAVSLTLSFAQVLDLAGQLRDALGVAVSARLAHLLLVLAPAAGLVAWGVSDLRETPLRLAAPDITWLARVVRPEELFVVRLLRDLPCVALVSALGGALLGEIASAHLGLWAAACAVLMLTARLFALDTALPRSVAEPRRRRAATVVASAIVAASGLALLLAAGPLAALLPWALSLGVYSVVVVLLVDLLLLGMAGNRSCYADMAFVVDDSELYAARRSMRFLALADSNAYKEACRRRRAQRNRRARRTWRFRPGRLAPVSHAFASLVRRPSALLGLLSVGGLLVPMGALVMTLRPGVGVTLCWLVCACLALREPLELGHVFREDCRNRLVRSLLPFGRLGLLVLDALPALVVTLAASCAVSVACAAALGTDALTVALLSCALDALLALSCGLDDPAAPVRLGSVLLTSFSFGAVALVAVGLASLLGATSALACAALLVVLLARALR
ncbi:hypothetical protein [Olsenella sp. An290]|uniref:hypothetical protein n=1 Tax=Olsenella sp. An290 TaxID=1965625 RepID=UPI000B38FB77|nr:hypothetical protein [Olsenella sp. An290]OUO35325.1 hypothetical protein B5F84_03540 [Olsenella sp. An290]